MRAFKTGYSKQKLRNVTAMFVVVGSLLPATVFCQKGDAGSMAEKLDSFIEKAFALDLTPGMAVAAIQGSDVIYARGFGYADLQSRRPVSPETMFYIASTTKSFTAFAAAILDDRGELDLDNTVGSYLPNLRLQSPLSADDITMRDLLTHTHGIEGGGPVVFRTAYTGMHTHEQLVELLSAYGPASGGRSFNYGNIGYNIASFAMDASLGISWKELLQREVFKPLGMNSTSAYLSKIDPHRLAMPYVAEEKGYRRLHYAKSDANMHAAGGHVSTVLDLAKWLQAHINSGRIAGKQVFPEKVVAETHRKQADQDRNFANFHRYGWGLGWDLGTYEGDTLIHRFGSFSGFRSHVSFMPKQQIGVVVLVNEGRLGSFLADMVACSIYDRLLEKPGLDEKLEQFQMHAARGRERIGQDKARRAARPQKLPHPLATYAGIYENDEFGRMEWHIVDGKFEVKMGLLRSPVEVYNGEQNQLRVALTGRGEVVGFSIQGDLAESLTYADRKFVRIDH